MSNTGKLVIKTMNKPKRKDTEELWGWFCDVFDLATKNAIEPDMLKEIAGESMYGEGITSKDLKKKLEMPQSTVIYHLNRFIYSGLVVRKGRRYYLRSGDMASTVEELQADMLREFDRITEFAERLDQIMESDMYARQKGRRDKQ